MLSVKQAKRVPLSISTAVSVGIYIPCRCSIQLYSLGNNSPPDLVFIEACNCLVCSAGIDSYSNTCNLSPVVMTIGYYTIPHKGLVL